MQEEELPHYMKTTRAEKFSQRRRLNDHEPSEDGPENVTCDVDQWATRCADIVRKTITKKTTLRRYG